MITDRWMQTHVTFAAERDCRTDDVGRLARDVMMLAAHVAHLQGRDLMDIVAPGRQDDK